MIRRPWVLPHLICPACGERVEPQDAGTLACARGHSYAVCDGVPRLRTGDDVPEETLYLRGLRGRVRRIPGLYRWAFRLLSPVLVTGPDAAQVVAREAEEGIVLDLGAGNERRHPRFCSVDLLPYPEVDVVADGQRLPFAAGSVDGLVSVATLEHVPRLPTVLGEIARVVKPGGRIFLVVPFLQPFHAAPHDYRRWTLPGLEAEFEDRFQKRRAGVYCGPASALAWVLAETLAVLLSAGQRRLQAALTLPLQVLCSPLKWLDVILARLPAASVMASALYYEGVRRAEGSTEGSSSPFS